MVLPKNLKIVLDQPALWQYAFHSSKKSELFLKPFLSSVDPLCIHHIGEILFLVTICIYLQRIRALVSDVINFVITWTDRIKLFVFMEDTNTIARLNRTTPVKP